MIRPLNAGREAGRKAWQRWSALVLAAGLLATGATAQELVPPLPATPTLPNFGGLAFGSAPEYFGSSDRISAPAPVLRLQQPGTQRAAAVFGNVFTSNILDHPILRTGPTGVYRFGRNDVTDPVVALLPEVDRSVDIGWTVGAEYVDPGDAARRVRADASFRADVTGAHDGFVAGISASGWTPTPFFLLGAFLSYTWGSEDYMNTYFSVDAEGAAASGLPGFEASAGSRDLTAGLVALVPLSERVVAGAGVIYI
jgi:outer membrane protein